MKYALIKVPDDFEKGQCYDCPLYADDCCVLHCRYDECPLEVNVLDKIRTEIETLHYLNIEDGSDGYDKYIEQYEVLQIINKYKTERCGEESE